VTADRVRARVFGEVADEYDRIRPGYPDQLVDDVLAYARLAPNDRALEVGAGTGRSTLAFARRGVPIDAVEPDEAMAAVLMRRIAGHPGVTVTVCAFEDFMPGRPYGLLFSGQAWHWTDPATRWHDAASALAPGGALALFWNHDRPTGAAMDVLRAVLSEHAPNLVEDDDPIDGAALLAEWPHTELVTLAEFGELSQRLYLWRRVLSTQDYVGLLSTHSGYRVLDETVRTALFRELADRLGVEVELQMTTALHLARRLDETRNPAV